MNADPKRAAGSGDSDPWESLAEDLFGINLSANPAGEAAISPEDLSLDEPAPEPPASAPKTPPRAEAAEGRSTGRPPEPARSPSGGSAPQKRKTAAKNEEFGADLGFGEGIVEDSFNEVDVDADDTDFVDDLESEPEEQTESAENRENQRSAEKRPGSEEDTYWDSLKDWHWGDQEEPHEPSERRPFSGGGGRRGGGRRGGERRSGGREQSGGRERSGGRRGDRPPRSGGHSERRGERQPEEREGRGPRRPHSNRPHSDRPQSERPRSDRPRRQEPQTSQPITPPDDFGEGLLEENVDLRNPPVDEFRRPITEVDAGTDLEFGELELEVGEELSMEPEGAPGEEAESDRDVRAPRRRRRRRSRSRRDRGPRPDAATVADEDRTLEPEIGEEDELRPEETTDEADTLEAERPRRRRRRRRRRPAGQRPDRGATTSTSSLPEEADDEEDDFEGDVPSMDSALSEDEDTEGDEESPRVYRNVPTWEEAISYLLHKRPGDHRSRDSESGRSRGSRRDGGRPHDRSERPHD